MSATTSCHVGIKGGTEPCPEPVDPRSGPLSLCLEHRRAFEPGMRRSDHEQAARRYGEAGKRERASEAMRDAHHWYALERGAMNRNMSADDYAARAAALEDGEASWALRGLPLPEAPALRYSLTAGLAEQYVRGLITDREMSDGRWSDHELAAEARAGGHALIHGRG